MARVVGVNDLRLPSYLWQQADGHNTLRWGDGGASSRGKQIIDVVHEPKCASLLGGNQPSYFANLFNINDGTADHHGSIKTRRWYHGGEDHQGDHLI